MSFAALAVAAISVAQPGAGDAPAPWHINPSVVTTIPLLVGGRVDVEGPHRISFGLTLGFLPGPYVKMINGVVVALDGYDDVTAEVIEAALDSSLVMRLQAGWRPWADGRFYALLNYSLITLGGGVGGEELFAVVSGTPPVGSTGMNRSYAVDSTLHQLGFEAGWWWVFSNRLSLRLTLGFSGTVASKTTVEPEFNPVLPTQTARFADNSADTLDDLYRSYVFTPTFGVAVGYDFLLQPEKEEDRLDERDMPRSVERDL